MRQAFVYTRGGPHWETIRLPFSDFLLTYHGYVQNAQSSLNESKARWSAARAGRASRANWRPSSRPRALTDSHGGIHAGRPHRGPVQPRDRLHQGAADAAAVNAVPRRVLRCAGAVAAAARWRINASQDLARRLLCLGRQVFDRRPSRLDAVVVAELVVRVRRSCAAPPSLARVSSVRSMSCISARRVAAATPLLLDLARKPVDLAAIRRRRASSAATRSARARALAVGGCGGGCGESGPASAEASSSLFSLSSWRRRGCCLRRWCSSSRGNGEACTGTTGGSPDCCCCCCRRRAPTSALRTCSGPPSFTTCRRDASKLRAAMAACDRAPRASMRSEGSHSRQSRRSATKGARARRPLRSLRLVMAPHSCSSSNPRWAARP